MDRAQRKNQILSCARTVFAEKGYHGANIADIIDRAGVARGTFYLYFESKRAIFEELLDGLIERLQARVRLVDTTRGPEVVLAELRDNLDGILGILLSDPAYPRILFHEAVGLDDGFDQKLGEFYGRVLVLLAESLELGQRIGLIRPLDNHLAARFLLGSLKELFFDQTLSGGTLETAGERARDELLSFYLHGIAAPGLFGRAAADGGSAS